MSAEPLPPPGPRLAPVDREGFGERSLGRRVEVVALDTEVRAQALRLLAFVPAPKLAALLRTLADRLDAASADRDSGEGTVRYSWHGGRFKAFRSNPDDVL